MAEYTIRELAQAVVVAAALHADAGSPPRGTLYDRHMSALGRLHHALHGVAAEKILAEINAAYERGLNASGVTRCSAPNARTCVWADGPGGFPRRAAAEEGDA